MYEPGIPSQYRLRVKQRLVVIAYAEENGVKPAGRHFGINRKTVRQWRDRHRSHGVVGLLPRYPKRRRRRVAPEVIPLVRQARTAHGFGAARTRIWLQRVHGISIAAQTIQRLFRDLGLQRLPSRRKKRTVPGQPTRASTQAWGRAATGRNAGHWSEASIRASEHAELVAKSDRLQEKIAARGEGRPECGDYPEGVTHRA